MGWEMCKLLALLEGAGLYLQYSYMLKLQFRSTLPICGTYGTPTSVQAFYLHGHWWNFHKYLSFLLTYSIDGSPTNVPASYMHTHGTNGTPTRHPTYMWHRMELPQMCQRPTYPHMALMEGILLTCGTNGTPTRHPTYMWHREELPQVCQRPTYWPKEHK
jgi:hypothetical protein